MDTTRIIYRDVSSLLVSGDLALLKLSMPLSLTNWDGIRPACLPAYDPDFSGQPAVHSGYGRLTKLGEWRRAFIGGFQLEGFWKDFLK